MFKGGKGEKERGTNPSLNQLCSLIQNMEEATHQSLQFLIEHQIEPGGL